MSQGQMVSYGQEAISFASLQKSASQPLSTKDIFNGKILLRAPSDSNDSFCVVGLRKLIDRTTLYSLHLEMTADCTLHIHLHIATCVPNICLLSLEAMHGTQMNSRAYCSHLQSKRNHCLIDWDSSYIVLIFP
jgi:hypothetical protein